MRLSPLTTPWIPTDLGAKTLLSAFDQSAIIQDLGGDRCHPLTRVAILRLMLWVRYQSEGNPIEWLNDHAAEFEVYSGRWLQHEAASQATGKPRHPKMVVEHIDENNLALNPEIARTPSPVDILQGLLTAYMCDRQGLKSPGPGLPRSGSEPQIVGTYVVMPRGKNLAETLELNASYMSDAVADQIMHPYRRLWVTESGMITVCASGVPSPDRHDPWVKLTQNKKGEVYPQKSRPQIPDDFDAGIDGPIDISALATNQAKPLAHYRISLGSPEKVEIASDRTLPKLTLALSGPMQSWNTDPRMENRQAGGKPSHSAILGLLACALGLGRTEDWGELKTLKIRVDARQGQPGIGADFQVVRGGITYGGDAERAIVTRRAYQTEREYWVEITHPDRDLIDKLAHAVQFPRWQLYLGRRAYVPTRPIFAGVS